MLYMYIAGTATKYILNFRVDFKAQMLQTFNLKNHCFSKLICIKYQQKLAVTDVHVVNYTQKNANY